MADMIPQGRQEADASAAGGYERGDANIRAVVLTMVIILTSCAVVVALLIPMFSSFTARERRKDATRQRFMRSVRFRPSHVCCLRQLMTRTRDSLSVCRRRAVHRLDPAPERAASLRWAARTRKRQSRSAINYTGDNQLPWDKMLNEAAVEEAQYSRIRAIHEPGKSRFPSSAPWNWWRVPLKQRAMRDSSLGRAQHRLARTAAT
jgi:hypothetical protein